MVFAFFSWIWRSGCCCCGHNCGRCCCWWWLLLLLLLLLLWFFFFFFVFYFFSSSCARYSATQCESEKFRYGLGAPQQQISLSLRYNDDDLTMLMVPQETVARLHALVKATSMASGSMGFLIFIATGHYRFYT